MRARAVQILILAPDRSRRRDEALHAFLAERAFRVRTLRDARRAAALVGRGQAQAVLLVPPARTPSLEELLARLRDANDDVPVVVLAMRPSVEEAAAAVAGRAFAYLSGEAFGAELDACLERILVEKGYVRTAEGRLLGVVGTRLREARTAQGLTLKQLAHRTGLSVSLVSQVERARNAPSLATLYQMCRALRLKLADLFAGY